MDFIRKINRNVQESFSIINEGIQITNGILEVKTIHLPQLRQLSPGAALRSAQGGVCCVLEEYVASTGGGGRSARENAPEPREPQQPTARGRLISRLKLSSRRSAGPSGQGGPGEGQPAEPPCALGAGCLVRKFSRELYKEGLDFVALFLSSLGRALEDAKRSSRKVIEAQSSGVLYEISQLYDVALLLKSQGGGRARALLDAEAAHAQLLGIVGGALRLLNEVLRYPLGAYHALAGEQGEGRVERRRYDRFLRLRFPGAGIDEYELVGSFALVHLTEEDKRELDQYLSQLDAVLEQSENSRLVLRALVETHQAAREPGGVGQGSARGDEYQELVLGLLLLLQKLFAYNDLEWHLFESEGAPCLWSSYYGGFSHHMLHGRACYDCGKRSFSEDLAEQGDFCDCFLRRDRCDFRVKVALEEAMRADRRVGEMLLLMLGEQRQTYLRSRILKLLVHLSGQLGCFRELMRGGMGVEAVLSTLEHLSRDQFYLLNAKLDPGPTGLDAQPSGLDTVQGEDSEKVHANGWEGARPKSWELSEEDLEMLSSFPPCTLECVLLLHRYAVMSRWHVPDPRGTLAEFARNLLLVYTCRSCSSEPARAGGEAGGLATVLPVVLETLVFSQFGRTLPEESEVHVVNLVRKLDPGGGWGALEGRVDAETFNLGCVCFALLAGALMLGAHVDPHVLRALVNYLALAAGVLNALAQAGSSVGALGARLGDLPELYTRLLGALSERELASRQPDQAVRLRADALAEPGWTPILHLALVLLDPEFEVAVPSKFKRDVGLTRNYEQVFNLAAVAGMFSPESTLGRSVDCYLCQMCAELESALEDGREEQLAPYTRFVQSYASILLSSHLASNDYSQVCFLSEYGLGFVLALVSRIVANYLGRGVRSVELLSRLLELVLYVPGSLGNRALERVDLSPLFEVVELRLEDDGALLCRGMAAVAIMYLLTSGVIREWDFGRLGGLASCLGALYLSEPVAAAQEALRLDNIQPVDSLGLTCEGALERFLGALRDASRTDLLELLFWPHTNAFEFPLPPHAFKFILLFKLYLHPHLFARFSGLLRGVSSSEKGLDSCNKVVDSSGKRVEHVTGLGADAHGGASGDDLGSSRGQSSAQLWDQDPDSMPPLGPHAPPPDLYTPQIDPTLVQHVQVGGRQVDLEQVKEEQVGAEGSVAEAEDVGRADPELSRLDRTDAGKDDSLRLLKRLLREEAEFARQRVGALQSQLNVLANSLCLSYGANEVGGLHTNLQKMRHRIRELEEQLAQRT